MLSLIFENFQRIRFASKRYVANQEVIPYIAIQDRLHRSEQMLTFYHKPFVVKRSCRLRQQEVYLFISVSCLLIITNLFQGLIIDVSDIQAKHCLHEPLRRELCISLRNIKRSDMQVPGVFKVNI